jgi:magnesium transporter
MLMVKKMDEQPKMMKLEEILRIRDNSLFVQGVAEEQNTCLDMLHDMDVESDGVDFAKIEGALAMLVKTSESIEQLCKHLESRVTGLKNAFVAHQQDRLSRRLAMLTILSAIFLPLTFLAGVYGMNFDNMPELHYEYSYFILWGSMWFVAISMTLFFYLDGWFS